MATSPNAVETTTWTSSSTRQVSREWLDGRGRPIQTASVRASNQVVVAQTQYHAAGRLWRSWKPVLRSVSNAYTAVESFVAPATLAAEAQAAYAAFEGNGSTEAANRPFSEVMYAPDALGRAAYARDPGSVDKGVRTLYGVARPDSGLVHPRGAVPMMAYVETCDADGRRSRTFTDIQGLTRFVRAGVGTAPEALTEQLYDAAGRLVLLLPPLYFTPRGGRGGQHGVGDDARWRSISCA